MAAADGAEVAFEGPARERVTAARRTVEEAVAAGATVYGVTTGFGALAGTRIDPSDASRLQHGILRSHATAVGPLLTRRETRAMLLLRAHVLALGHSGVRPEVVDLMIEMLNRDVVPAVPQQGSLGASGDLAPLATLALPLIGLGRVLVGDGPGSEPAADAFARAGLATLELAAKEGLALVNGTQGMVAIGLLTADRASRLARTADVVAAMTIEAALGTDAPFDERLQQLRPHARLARERGEPAPSARRLADPRLAPRQPAPRPGRLLAPLCAPGARRGAGRLFVRAGGALDRGERRDRQPDRARGRRRDQVRGKLPRPAGGGCARRPGDRVRGARLDLGAAFVPAARPGAVERTARVPDPGKRAEQRVHARSVHGGIARVGVQVARPSRVGRLDPVLGGAGGPREHGDDRGAPRAGRADQRRDGRGARGARRRSGPGSSSPARARAGDARRAPTRFARGSRSR